MQTVFFPVFLPFWYKAVDNKWKDFCAGLPLFDFGTQQVIDELESVTKLIAVNGNCDFDSFKTLEGFTKEFEIFNFEGLKTALTHTPYDLEQWAKNNTAQLYIHGHTHEPYIEQKDNGEIWICPGSASMGRYGSPNSIASLYVGKDQIIAGELIEV